MDPGQQLLALVDERVRRGMDRHAAKAAVFRDHRELVDAWHGAGASLRETELDTYPGVQLTTHDDPGQALLALVNGYVALGMDPAAAKWRAMREHPTVTAAYDRGELIPKAPVRPRGNLRRVRAADMVEGKPYLHLCSDEASGGGIFAVGH